jgi:hypothetical protein
MTLFRASRISLGGQPEHRGHPPYKRATKMLIPYIL